MKSFLSEVAKEVYSKHNNLSSIVLILPSKRAATFIKNEFIKIISQSVISPTIYSIEEFIQELANLKLTTNIQLLFEFYEVYKSLTPEDQQEDFYNFTGWAQTMLQDFNEIDRYLVDPENFFTHLFHIKEIDQFHWTHSEEKTLLQKNYLTLWKRLHQYYKKLNEHLLAKGIGYQGTIYKEANENASDYLHNNPKKQHYFIGFNALNKAEQHIFQDFLAAGNTAVYWDIDEKFIQGKEHDAGLFIRQYIAHWPFYRTNEFKLTSKHFSEEKNIEIIGIPKNVGQAKYVGSLLNKKSLDVKQTAIVLGNENLLGAILNSIPQSITSANITSGFPLGLTPLASFFETLLSVWENNPGKKWYYKDLLTVFSNPITKILTGRQQQEIDRFLFKIKKENTVYVDETSLKPLHVSELLLPRLEDAAIQQIISNCLHIIDCLKEAYKQEQNRLFLEYLFGFYEVFNQLQLYNNSYNAITSIKSLRKVYASIVSLQTIDFKGEPLEGLQIMGMLESRNLDFETVVLTSVNEAILPAGKSNNSFVPFDLKVAFGLPTYKEKDAIYSYHFYRLLQRAKNIYLLYNTEPDALEGGEKSRLLQQLTMLKEKNHHIQEYVASAQIKNDKTTLTTIAKDDALINSLIKIGKKGFSPTSLTNYIRNPIDFYTQTVLGIKEVEEVEETIAANTLGTIVHDTLEYFYKPLEGQFLTLEHIQQMQSDVAGQIANHFSKSFSNAGSLQGKNLISYHIAKRYIENFLSFEATRLKQGKQIKIVHIESSLKTTIHIKNTDFSVYLKGKVDRVEQEDGILQIIDYKTGKVAQGDVEIVNWEDLSADYKYSKAFQILCYAYLIHKETPINEFRGGIISFKNMQNGILNFAKKDKHGRGAQRNQTINKNVLDRFSRVLETLILEIFNKEIPLKEKEIETHAY